MGDDGLCKYLIWKCQMTWFFVMLNEVAFKDTMLEA